MVFGVEDGYDDSGWLAGNLVVHGEEMTSLSTPLSVRQISPWQGESALDADVGHLRDQVDDVGGVAVLVAPVVGVIDNSGRFGGGDAVAVDDPAQHPA